MYIIFNFKEQKELKLSAECYIVYKALRFLDKKNITGYRQTLSNITGLSVRSITRYFKILKEKGLVNQKKLYSPVTTKIEISEEKKKMLEDFKKLMEDLKWKK